MTAGRQTLGRPARTASTMSMAARTPLSISKCELSSKYASGAAFRGATGRFWSRSSRLRMSASTKASSASSPRARASRVREVLVNFQRQFASDPPGSVLDGRDIGTVICPDADVKIFVVADPKVRARRRTLEARARGEDADEAAVLADILKRDERDQNRAVAPLKPASDAYLLDNSQLDIEGGVRAAIDIVEAVRAGRPRV